MPRLSEGYCLGPPGEGCAPFSKVVPNLFGSGWVGAGARSPRLRVAIRS